MSSGFKMYILFLQLLVKDPTSSYVGFRLQYFKVMWYWIKEGFSKM
jgi:hypothetical protein